ncbi:MAG: hypothetical protein JSU95_13865 [Betaproteobacteria bacterium]|nr:MAG: hypothetical protein JSU95_13865 [Betaproteobacteria bacterium]
MPRQVVILHGWSDNSDSFKPLAAFLKQNGFAPYPIYLGDYISLRDDVQIGDVAKRMEEVIKAAQSRSGQNRLAAKFDMIVHSTGGLVARHWISTYYQSLPCPVQNLVMLAPANFGSALAHLGRSLLGRVLKGWRTGFETGEEMLHALELGSPYQWRLAQDDLFVPEGSSARSSPVLYAPDKVRPFVLIGTYPYQELAARITNENGSDGTVRVSAANLNCQGMTVDFSGSPSKLKRPAVRQWTKRGAAAVSFPLAVLPDRTHGDIVRPSDPGATHDPDVRTQLGKLILQALRSTPASYARIAEDWRQVSMATRELARDETTRKQLFKSKSDAAYFHEHFQLVVRAEDEFGDPIHDFFVRFVKRPRRNIFRAASALDRATAFFHEEVLEAVHAHRRSPEYRNFYIDRYDMMRTGGWYDQIPSPAERQLLFSLTAADPGDRVAYFERKPGARGVVFLHRQGDGERWLKRHTTHFVRVIVPRAGEPGIFTLKRG